MSVGQIGVLAGSALLIGMGKTGLPFLTMLGVLIMASAFDPSESVAIVLLLYLPCDMVAVTIYRRYTRWRVILPMLPFFVVGIGLASVLAEHLPPRGYGLVLGLLLLSLTAYNLLRSKRPVPISHSTKSRQERKRWLHCASYSCMTGFSSMLGNVGGPFSFLYLISLNLKKRELMGSFVWIFALGNLIKLAFHVFYRHSINATLPWKPMFLIALPALLVGAVLGPFILARVNEKAFRLTLYAVTLAGGMRLLYQNLF